MGTIVFSGIRQIIKASQSAKTLQQARVLCASSNVCKNPFEYKYVWPVNARIFHTSRDLNVGKAKNTKRKIVKEVKFGAKGRKDLKVVTIWRGMTVQELADSMGKDVDHIFEVFLYVPGSDSFDSPDAVIDNLNILKLTCEKSGFRHKLLEKKVVEHKDKDAYKQPPPDPSQLRPRPPVVTIMGHVDHGKTTLLDALRHSHTVDTEFGGITQHIGAFSVKLKTDGKQITFLDTPGHAAFGNMRARGAHITDIIILVVAADDSVMKQTVESIELAHAENVPIIVAINKIDKVGADIERTKHDLLQNGVQLEDQGGDVQVVPISAFTGENVEELKEAILAQAELMELGADMSGLVEGTVIESSTHLGRGKLATILVQRGTLKKGACLVAGTSWAKVRGMFNDAGRPTQEVKPGTAVEVIGWKDLPSAGDQILQVESEHRAREVIQYRLAQLENKRIDTDSEIIHKKAQEHVEEYQRLREEKLARGKRRGAIYRNIKTKEVIETHTGPELAVVIKGDVDGTLEAILDILDSYESSLCRLHLLSYGVGDISQHDIDMATAFNGVIYGFNVNIDANIIKNTSKLSVPIKKFNVIYKLFDDLKKELSSRVETVAQDELKGEAHVLAQFVITEGKKKMPVAGCRCVQGSLHKKFQFKLIRDGEEIMRGPLQSLKHYKNEVESIKKDVECGLMFQDMNEIPQPGDIIQCFEETQIKPDIDWHLDF